MSSADPTELDRLLGEWTGTWDHERLFEELKEAGYAIVSYKMKPGDRWIDAQDLEHHNTLYKRWREALGMGYQKLNEVLTCPGCGEFVPRAEAYRDSVLPFHWNEQGGGHTMERDYYGPHPIICESTGKQAFCLGEGFCRWCTLPTDDPIPYALVDNPPTEGS